VSVKNAISVVRPNLGLFDDKQDLRGAAVAGFDAKWIHASVTDPSLSGVSLRCPRTHPLLLCSPPTVSLPAKEPVTRNQRPRITSIPQVPARTGGEGLFNSFDELTLSRATTKDTFATEFLRQIRRRCR